MSSKAPRMRSAVRHLINLGEAALRPKKVDEKMWAKPLISKRIANVVRKQAMKDGTFGSFNPQTGTGWDPKWDAVGQVGTDVLKPPKGNKQQRTREARAVKIDAKMVGMDERIDEHLRKRTDNKPPITFDVRYKRLLALSRKK
jgi:hypothetical protein